jgi:O-acetyl-ADP-ribose deacetylase (regulator of RNase III)
MSSSSSVNGITVLVTYPLPSGLQLAIAQGSVVDFSCKTGAIVNAANEGCLGGGGIDGAISNAGGRTLAQARLKLPLVPNEEGEPCRCPTGQAVVTGPGEYGSLKVPYVIHAVGPNYREYADAEKADELLRSAYQSVLDEAVATPDLTDVAFCLLSAGIFRGSTPLPELLRESVQALAEWEPPAELTDLKDIYMCGYSVKETKVLEQVAKAFFQEQGQGGGLLPSHPPGKDLQVGSTVRICHLTCAAGRERLNETIAVITGEMKEERFLVELRGGRKSDRKVRIKPENLRIVCSSCWSDQKAFKRCGHCKIATYCNIDCQRTHWKKGGHKAECQRLAAKRVGLWHPSWKKLTAKQFQDLQELHEKSGCTVPWPIAGAETSAMLLGPAFCFLANHPSMRFKIVRENMPAGGFVTHNDDPLSDVSGQRAPEGRSLWILKEDFSWGPKQFDAKQYYSTVPPHLPVQVVYAVIAEVLWTEIDYQEMKAYYERQPGRFFEWPGVECVGICPGTGKKVPFSRTEKHLLVACNLQGSAMEGNSVLAMATRVMPRILTLAGYEKMMGPSGPHRNVLISKTPGGPKEPVAFYPDFFRETQRDNPLFYNASRAFDRFHATGLYKAFERWLDDEKERNRPRVHDHSTWF